MTGHVIKLGKSVKIKDGKLINYSTPKKSVQYIVIDLAGQVGLGYN